jgi:hypothetical protein
MKKARNKVLLLLMVFVLTCFAISSIAEAQPWGPDGGLAVVFPYIVKDDPNTITLVTVVVPSPSASNDCAATIHYRYYYKSFTSPDPSTADITATCSEQDFAGKTSPNDMVTFDITGMLGGGNPLLSDTNSGNLKASDTLALTTPGPQIGYLVAEVLDAQEGTACTAAGHGPNLNWGPYGEALIIDIANGGASGYRGWGDYWNHDEPQNLYDNYTVPTTAFPDRYAKTSFAVTPYNFEGEGSCEGTCTGTDVPGTQTWGASGTYDSSLLQVQKAVVQLITIDNVGTIQKSVYDRNENRLSSTIPQKVTCIGVLKLSDLLDNGIKSSPSWVAGGGWAYMWNPAFYENGLILGDVLHWENDAWIYKIESSSAFGPFMTNMQPTGGDAWHTRRHAGEDLGLLP